mgnify:CR=1 FL=1
MSERPGMEAMLRERAQREPEFRARLLEDPKGAVADALGLEFPEQLSVRVVEEQPGEVVVVVPPAPESGAELTDAELEQAAGGWDPSTTAPFSKCPC